jgi:hypothetical protein
MMDKAQKPSDCETLLYSSNPAAIDTAFLIMYLYLFFAKDLNVFLRSSPAISQSQTLNFNKQHS